MRPRKPFIVAEIGANHGGELGCALALVEAAYHAGADAVKLQTYTPEQMAEPGVMIEAGPWAGLELIELYRRCVTPREWHAPLFERAKEHGMVGFSSVFHPDDVDFLEALDCPIYKIASFELTDTDLIAHAAKTGKPMIISTGMGSIAEIAIAARAASDAGCRDLTLLKCSSAYPAPIEAANLQAMQLLTRIPGCTAGGYSDHTLGPVCAIVATALGAAVIEKHLSLSKYASGPDAAFSAPPEDFKVMVDGCRQAAQAVGSLLFEVGEAERAHVPLRRAAGGKRGQ